MFKHLLSILSDEKANLMKYLCEGDPTDAVAIARTQTDIQRIDWLLNGDYSKE